MHTNTAQTTAAWRLFGALGPGGWTGPATLAAGFCGQAANPAARRRSCYCPTEPDDNPPLP